MDVMARQKSEGLCTLSTGDSSPCGSHPPAPAEGNGRQNAKPLRMSQLRSDLLGIKRGTKREDEGNVAREVGDFRPG